MGIAYSIRQPPPNLNVITVHKSNLQWHRDTYFKANWWYTRYVISNLAKTTTYFPAINITRYKSSGYVWMYMDKREEPNIKANLARRIGNIRTNATNRNSNAEMVWYHYIYRQEQIPHQSRTSTVHQLQKNTYRLLCNYTLPGRQARSTSQHRTEPALRT